MAKRSKPFDMPVPKPPPLDMGTAIVVAGDRFVGRVQDLILGYVCQNMTAIEIHRKLRGRVEMAALEKRIEQAKADLMDDFQEFQRNGPLLEVFKAMKRSQARYRRINRLIVKKVQMLNLTSGVDDIDALRGEDRFYAQLVSLAMREMSNKKNLKLGILQAGESFLKALETRIETEAPQLETSDVMQEELRKAVSAKTDYYDEEEVDE